MTIVKKELKKSALSRSVVNFRINKGPHWILPPAVLCDRGGDWCERSGFHSSAGYFQTQAS